MKYKVSTAYEAYNEATNRYQGFSTRAIIEANSKEEAKAIAWKMVLDDEGAATLKEQRARVVK